MSIQSARTLHLSFCIAAALMAAAGPSVAELAAEATSMLEHITEASARIAFEEVRQYGSPRNSSSSMTERGAMQLAPF